MQTEQSIKSGFVTITSASASASARKVFALPVGARLLSVGLSVKTAFDGGGTLTLGASETTAEYLPAQPLTSVTILNSHFQTEIDEANAVFAKVGGSGWSVGEAEISFIYALPTKRAVDY